MCGQLSFDAHLEPWIPEYVTMVTEIVPTRDVIFGSELDQSVIEGKKGEKWFYKRRRRGRINWMKSEKVEVRYISVKR